MNIIEKNISEIKTLCEKHNVASLFLFGSYAKQTYTTSSDIDLLVNFSDDIDLYSYYDNYFDFLSSLENLLNKKIDLVSEKYIKNPYLKKSIEKGKKLIYERRPANMAA